MIQLTQIFGEFILQNEINTKRKCFFYCLRYTSSNDTEIVYAFLLKWPSNTTEILFGAPVSSSNTIVTLLGSTVGPLTWRGIEGKSSMIIDVSNIQIYSLESDWVWVFKLQHISAKERGIFRRKYRRW